MVEGLVEILNKLLWENIIYETMRPSMIVEEKGKIYMGLKMIEFGAYAMVYVGTKNTMKIRSVSEIALKASNDTV